jgi:predicted NBD/HSP70 family sugar kinase
MRRISPTGFRIARRGTSREINRKIALNLIRERQPISRAELARLMGVRRGGISRLVDDLLESGLVFEGAKGESRRGRKPMHLHLETRQRCVLAVDISASHTAIMVTDVLGHPLLDAVEFRTRRQPTALVEDMVRRIRRILEQHPEVGSCVGVGISMSGVMDSQAGRVRYSPTIGWRDVDLASPLQTALKLPVVVENSCKACVLAQVWAVRGDAPVDGPVAFVNVSDGVGVGIAIDGKLLRGARNVAGEFGHVPLSGDTGPRCSCGQRGCWETYVSKRAMIARYLGKDPSWPESAQLHEVSVEEIIERARMGDRRAMETLRETGRQLGRGFATIIKTIDPKRIYLGGEITAAWDLIASTARQAMHEDTLIRDVGETEILIVGLGEHARLRGAAALISTPAFAAPVVS